LKIQFNMLQRKNRFAKNGKEWAFNVRRYDDPEVLTLCAFDRKPSDKDIEVLKEVAIRSMEFYHRNVKIPDFNMVAHDEY
jgi:hypothetical protein